MSNTDLSFMFEEPLSVQERQFEEQQRKQQKEQEDSPDQPQISTDNLTKLFNKDSEEETQRAKQATWDDVLKSGGIRAVAGIPQGFMALAESSGALPKGSTADFTKQVLALENSGDMGIAKEFTRDTLSNIIPIVAEIMATRGANFMQTVKRTAAIGGSGGFFTFVDNPETAGPLSTARFLNTSFGATLGPMFAGVFLGAGNLTSRITGGLGETSVSGGRIAPDLSTRQQGAETIQQGAEKGLVVTPGAATGDVGLAAQEKNISGAFSEDTARFISDVIGSNAKTMNELVDDLVSTIVPEGKEQIPLTVGRLYNAASVERLPQNISAQFRQEPIIQDIVTRVMNNPGSREAYTRYPVNSIGRFNFIIKELQSEIDKVPGTDTADYLIKLKDRMRTAATGVSDNYRLAVDASQREKTAIEVLEALKRGGGSDIIPNINSASSFVSNFSNTKAKEAMVKGIRSLKDPAQQKAAMEKMEFLLKFIPKISQTEALLTKYLGAEGREFAERGGIAQAAFYSANNLLNANNNEKFIRFILDPQKSASRLKELMPKSNTTAEEVLKALGIISGEILSESSQGSFTVPFKQEEREAFKSSSVDSKAKAYRNLERSGRLEEFMAKRPDAYAILEDAYKKTAIV